MLRGADRLRRSLTPSLLISRRTNETLANDVIELFETANVYLPRKDRLPLEQHMLAITSGGDFAHLKGVVESLLRALNPAVQLEAVDTKHDLLDPVRSCELKIDGETLGYLGEVSADGLKRFDLRTPATVAELKMSVLDQVACLIPQHADQSPFPAIAQDLNLIVDEWIRWSQIEATVRNAGGNCLEDVQYRETYRDPEKDGPGRKRLLLSITLRSSDRTLTGEEAESIRDQIVAACGKEHAAVLLA